MKQLWSPWRMKYILQPKRASTECIFCASVRLEDGPENLVLARGKLAYVILNRYPYSSGHLMVVPYAHQPTFEELDTETRSEIMELMTRSMQAIRAVYRAGSFNVGANIGSPAGAGIAGHVHFHVVPRWAGDSNFITTIGGTRVLPEDLGETYRRLHEQWAKG